MDSYVPVVDFDSTDQGLLFGDLELFEQVRQAGGIAWSERNGGLWIIASHELCRTVASDHERFRSGDGIRFPRAGNPMIFALEYDRPRHTDHRKILTDLAGPRATSEIEPTVRAHARRLIEQSVPDGRLDLGAGYAYPLALDVIFSLIGAPDDIKQEMEVLAESLFLYRRPMPDGSDAAVRLREILERLVAERSADPDDSWISQIVAGANAPDGLTDAEVRGALVAVLTGGHHSTARGIACLLAHLVTDPDLQRLLRADRSRIGPLVEESLRLNTPLRWFARTAAVDVKIGGQLVRSGQRVYLLYAGANRDPKRFTQPDRLNPEGLRASEHLAFGWGIHRCVGMPLAQLEMRVAVEELLDASDWLRPDGDIEWLSAVDARHIPCRMQ